jgi:hypothetical protein
MLYGGINSPVPLSQRPDQVAYNFEMSVKLPFLGKGDESWIRDQSMFGKAHINQNQVQHQLADTADGNN